MWKIKIKEWILGKDEELDFEGIGNPDGITTEDMEYVERKIGLLDEEDNDDPDEAVLICPHCGGSHVYTCPRLSRIDYYEAMGSDEPTIKSVEYDKELSRELWKYVIWRE